MSRFELVKKGTETVVSKIKENFSREFMKKVYDIYIDDCMSIVEKTIRFDKIFTEEFGHRKDYRRIGEGTNRFVCLLDNHIVKVAYNYLAYIDNLNELARAKHVPKEFARAYESNGIILISEYVTVMDKDDFIDSQTEIGRILDKLASNINPLRKKEGEYYILGDMGMSSKNYGNWGRRTNGEIVVLDYGYYYKVPYEKWHEINVCPSCEGELVYTNDYSELLCNDCQTKVKYTTIRNNLGYEHIIKTIKEGLYDDVYVKFDENGKIQVDVMEEVEIVEEEVEAKLPEDVEFRLDNTMSRFFEIVELVKRNKYVDEYIKEDILEKLDEEEEMYDEVLFPMLKAAINISYNNAESYLNDMKKIFNERYDELLSEEVEKIHDEKISDTKNIVEELYDEPDFLENDDLSGNFDIDGSGNSFLDRLDKISMDAPVIEGVSLDDILSLDFSNIEMADDVKTTDGDISEDLSLEDMLNVLDEIDGVEKEEIVTNEGDLKEEFEEAYENLHRSLTELIAMLMGVTGEEFFIDQGDIYRTYLNGEFIDMDYSPEVNASNILGGSSPEEFAFPLYRHLLAKYDYDSEKAFDDFEAIYRLEETISVPSDLNSVTENREYVLKQIASRFETDIDTRTIKNRIGYELQKYYDVMDEYYKDFEPEEKEISIHDPEYYLQSAMKDPDLEKEIKAAKDELADELIQLGMKLDNMDGKVVYYYDVESMMDVTEEEIFDTIKHNLKCIDRNGEIKYNLKDEILNAYYATYGKIVNDKDLDIFKYGNSMTKELGYTAKKRIRRPILKAKIVDKNSPEDMYKPLLFDRVDYTKFIIEQRYEHIMKRDSETMAKINEIELALSNKNLYYYKEDFCRYRMIQSNDKVKFILTEKELALLNLYQERYGRVAIKDADKAYAKTILKSLDDEFEIGQETKIFMETVVEKGLNEAYAERQFRINILEMSGTMTRKEYLERI